MQNIRKIKGLRNNYCDAVGLALSEFFDIRQVEDEQEILCHLTDEDLKKFCEYAVIKNKIAGVEELFLKVPKKGLVGNFFSQYALNGKEILSARLIDCLFASDLVGERIMIEVENLLEYNEDYLSKIVDFCASTDTPVLVKLGQSLEEVGKVVNKFNSSPSEVLEEYGFLDRKCYIYGLNFLDKEDQRLLTQYKPMLILSPRDDGESGRGIVNLYNLIFNGLDFSFASGKCYQVDMFLEGKLAILNTSNLMYEKGLIDTKDILNSLQCERGEIILEMDETALEETLLDKNIEKNDEKLEIRLLQLREEVKQIIEKLR